MTQTIVGVRTSVAGFVGPARSGPTDGAPPLLTSFGEFERIYGGLEPLQFEGEASSVNYLAHAVRAFFSEGGQRLHVARIYAPQGGDGLANWTPPQGTPVTAVNFHARYPGAMGNLQVALTFHTSASTVDVQIVPSGASAAALVFEQVSMEPGHDRSLAGVFSDTADPAVPLVFRTTLDSGVAIAAAFADRLGPIAEGQTFVIDLTGGSDGRRPGASDYEGRSGTDSPRSGLSALEELDEVSVVAAPGSTAAAATPGLAQAVASALIGHGARMRFRSAVIDSVERHRPEEVRAFRGTLDSSRAALYYPWIKVRDPFAAAPQPALALPPSGFVAGIYARTDLARGVHRAPANEAVRLAIGVESTLTARDQAILNPEGINVIRSFQGRGILVWGARTLSLDPVWKYVNVRRYFMFLERSIEEGIRWVVFEPNGPSLWVTVQTSIQNFLHGEFRAGRLAGRRAEDAFFVRCDRTTMTQQDVDSGRLVCLVGVAPIRPAEFVTFRIGHWTGDAAP